ncbi:MAG: hypothetical protein ACJAX3_001613 [Patiriisocius sp.]|jgi:hypothetical protein
MTKLFLGQKTDRKTNILEATNGGLEVFQHYIADFKHLQKNFCSPLRSDKKPSANIFLGTGSEYLYKDFATGETLNCFDFVGKLKSVNDFTKIMTIIENEVMNISKPKKTARLENATATPVDKVIVTVLEKDNGNYWKQYTEDDFRANQYLEKYEVFALDSFQTNSGNTIKSNDHNPIYGFKISDGCYKIYQPLIDSKYKHQWIGSKPANFNNIIGIGQLPDSCDTILITEGYKDCTVSNTNLNQHGIYAVGLDNVSTKLSASTIEILKNKCRNLLLCMDIDEPGLKGAESKSKEHGLRILTLPDLLKQHEGKDISDWFKLKLSVPDLIELIKEVNATQPPEPELTAKKVNPILKKLLDAEQDLNIASQGDIESIPAVIVLGDIPIIKKGTINTIQGKFGSHKSRLAESICSLLLSDNQENDFVGLTKNESNLQVCYIDTERNFKEEFPRAIKSIRANAGDYSEANFRFTSLKKINRKDRLNAVKLYLTNICAKTSKDTFVILDVVTDCIGNFNDVEESLAFLDFVGNLCEEYEVTVLMVIHENPYNTKARGHVGTEATNKCSTVMGISVLNDSLIEVRYIKHRATKPLPSFYLTFDEKLKRLVRANDNDVSSRNSSTDEKANVNLVADFLAEFMTENKDYEQKELLETLMKEFETSKNTIKSRLSQISEDEIKIFNKENQPTILQIKANSGMPTMYSLSVVEELEEI